MKFRNATKDILETVDNMINNRYRIEDKDGRLYPAQKMQIGMTIRRFIVTNQIAEVTQKSSLT